VCLPYEVILEWIKMYKESRKPWVLSVSLASLRPSCSVWSGEDACVWGTWRTPPLVEKLLSADNIKVTKGLVECLRGRAFLSSQVVLL
jgi:hypothetical protein